MKINRSLPFTIGFVFCACITCWSQAGAPQTALEEIATATKIEDVEKHFPAKLVQLINELSPKEKAEIRQEMEKELLMSQQLKKSGLQLRKTGDGSKWEVVHDDGSIKGTIVVKNSFVSGVDALVLLQATESEKEKSETFAVLLHLEEGEWRITGAGDFHLLDFGAEEFLAKFHRGQSFSGATAFLRTLYTCLITYASTYPNIGLPASLDALAGDETSEPSPEHARILPPGPTGNPMVRGGYEFQYTRIDSDKFRVTARPVQFEPGTRSYFIDESAVIHSTTENRAANENDPPL